jgi:hypothetical protein
MQFFFDGSRWRGWSNRGPGPGGVALTRTAVASRGLRKLDVFALARAGRVLAHWWFDGAWHGPQDLGTGADRIALAGLGVTSWDSTRLDVVSIDAQQHGLVQDFWTAKRWNGPVRLDFPMGAAVTGPPTLAVTAAAVSAPITVMADPNPRDTPIPVTEEARATD